jgi:hypothetical protein
LALTSQVCSGRPPRLTDAELLTLAVSGSSALARPTWTTTLTRSRGAIWWPTRPSLGHLFPAVRDVLLRVSRLAELVSEIAGLDLNPCG